MFRIILYYIIFLYKVMYINFYTNILGLKYIFLCLMYSIGTLILKFSNFIQSLTKFSNFIQTLYKVYGILLYKVSHKTLPLISLYQKFLHHVYGL